jgi:hypothetical protein
MTGALRLSCFATLGAVALGCAPEFDKVSEIETLRILAVQKDKPYAKPGDGDPLTTDDAVKLRMLWRDSPEKAGRPVQLQWFTGCFNPPGDLFFSCFTPELKFLPLPAVTCPDPSGQPCNNEISLEIPPDVANRPPSSDPTQLPYGLAYVFYAICAGELKVVPPQNERDFPYGCFDPNGTRLGSDDFVAGYSAVYVYDDPIVNGQPLEVTNNNPPITGFSFNDAEVDPTFRCVNEECLDLKSSCDGNGMCRNLEQEWRDAQCGQIPCVAPCEDDGDETCPPKKIKPVLGPNFAEEDVVSNATRGRSITEQMWINYYAEAGGVKSEVRLLNDAFEGVNDDFGTEYYAPKDKPENNGVTVIWAVVHDNRGGMSWVGIPIRIE